VGSPWRPRPKRANLVGYNYLRPPAIRHVKHLLDSGELGRLTYPHAAFEEVYVADPTVPFSWRCERAKAGLGTLDDLGSHAVRLARHLGGLIVEVMADLAMVVPTRAAAPGGAAVGQLARIRGGDVGPTVESAERCA
jgi:predicted dehydrogenase